MNGQPVRFDITQVEREGSTTSLGVRLTTHSGYGASVNSALDDGVTQRIRGSDSRENAFSVDGIYLIDRTNARKYLVARDADNRCICDAGLGTTSVGELSPLHLSATYAAPPPGVRVVDVVVPLFGTFPNVPLA
jgi:hypothetical protein